MIPPEARSADMDRILTRAGPYTDPDSFTPGDEVQSFLRQQCKVLVIGERVLPLSRYEELV